MGNPAACIFIDSNQVLSGAHMQEIAMQHKGFVSEVVFCKQADSTVDLIYYSRFCTEVRLLGRSGYRFRKQCFCILYAPI